VTANTRGEVSVYTVPTDGSESDGTTALHVPPCCAITPVRHLEHFHDHERLERTLFDGVPEPVDGMLRPDVSRLGLGIELKRADANRYAA
jgi:enolase-like protein